MKIRVIIPIVGTEFNAAVKKEVESALAPDCEISYVNLSTGTASIESRYAEALNTADIVRLAREAAAEGVDGVYVDCFTGSVPVVRELIDIPVIGAFEAPCLTAMALAQKFSIITVVQRVIPIIASLARDLGIMESLASIRDIGIPVLELGDEAKVEQNLLDQSVQAIEEDGAEAIMLGCTGMLDVVNSVRTRLEAKGFQAPVINPTTTSIGMLETLIRNGLSQSRLTYYKTDDKVIRADAESGGATS